MKFFKISKTGKNKDLMRLIFKVDIQSRLNEWTDILVYKNDLIRFNKENVFNFYLNSENFS